ncbi:hypothetical protein CHH52_06575 [Shouchella clausii]|nr:hypothetical protein CHH52_06575 [Shouchella clausii]
MSAKWKQSKCMQVKLQSSLLLLVCFLCKNTSAVLKKRALFDPFGNWYTIHKTKKGRDAYAIS